MYLNLVVVHYSAVPFWHQIYHSVIVLMHLMIDCLEAR